MKKILIFIFVFCIFTFKAKSQMDVFIGSTFYNVQTTTPTKFGINTGFNTGLLYYTFSTNFVSNLGIYKESFINGEFKKRSLSSLNVGYNIPIKSIKELSITPYLGVIWSKDIYNKHGEIYNITGDNFYDFGITGKYYFYEDMAVMLSLGYRELVKISYCYKIVKR